MPHLPSFLTRLAEYVLPRTAYVGTAWNNPPDGGVERDQTMYRVQTNRGSIDGGRRVDERHDSLNEELFRRVFEDAPVGMVVISAEERVLQANQAFAEMLGYEVEELIDASIFDTTDANNLDAAKQERRDLLVDGGPVRWEKKLIRKDGTVIDVVINTSTITDDAGDIVQTISQVVDISERTRAEAIVRNSEARFKALFEKADDGIVVRDAESRTIVDVNEPFARRLGYRREELIGELVEKFSPRQQPETEGPPSEDADPDGVRRIVRIHVAKDGSEMPVEITGSQYEVNGRAYLVSFVRDVSRRAQVENALTLSEKRFRDFAEAGADRFWETDKDHRYTYMSPPSGSMKRPSEQLIGELPWGVASREHAAEEDAAIQRAFESRAAFRHVQNVGTTPDGDKRHLYLNGVPYFDENGEFAGFRGSTTDETLEVKARLQASMQQRQFNDAIENLNDAITIYDSDHKLIAANRKARQDYRQAGYQIEPGASLADVITVFRDRILMPNSDESSLITTDRVLGSLENGDANNIIQYRDGRWMSSHRYRTAEGGLLVYRTDITQEKMAEDELVQSANRFRDFGTIASDWFWEMDENLRFSYFSDRFVEISGVEKEQLLGKTRSESGLDRADKQVMQNIRALEAHRPFRDFEHSRVRPDGTTVHMSTSGVPVFDAGGNFQGYHGTGRDITAQKLAEAATIQSEKRFRDFGTIASDWFWEMDENLVFTYFSERYETITGVRISDVIGKRREDVRPPELTDEYWQSYIDNIEAHLPFEDFTHKRITPAGKTVWIATSGIPIFDATENFIGYRCIARDITEQKSVENVLRENEARLQDFGNSVADYYWELDEYYYISYLSDSYAEVTGVDPDGVLGKKRDEIPAEDVSEEDWATFLNTIRSHQPFREFVNSRTLPNGQKIWMSDSGVPHFDENGIFKGYRGVGRDITEEKRLEEDLRESQEQMASLVERTGEGYWDIDTGGLTRDLNPAMCKILGRERHEVIGKSIFDFVDDDNRRIFHRQIALRKQGRTGPYEVALTRPDGTLVSCVNNATPIFDSAGNSVGSVGLWTDISEIKRTLSELEEARAAAESANNAKSRFLASASHDLRQPLQSATLYIDVLHELVDDPKQLEIIKKSIGSLGATTDILNALLDVSKLDAGLVTPNPVDLCIKDVFTRVGDIEPIARNKGLEFRIVESNAWLHTDPALIETIVRNLLNNAVKYTDSGRVLLGARNTAGRVRIEIWDTGHGIPAGQLESVFEEFYQLNNPHRDRDLGLGLGLSIVKRLITLLGGELDVRSVVGRGTVFSVTLPAGQAVDQVIQ